MEKQNNSMAWGGSGNIFLTLGMYISRVVSFGGHKHSLKTLLDYRRSNRIRLIMATIIRV